MVTISHFPTSSVSSTKAPKNAPLPLPLWSQRPPSSLDSPPGQVSLCNTEHSRLLLTYAAAGDHEPRTHGHGQALRGAGGAGGRRGRGARWAWVGEAGRAKGFPPRFRVSLRIWASLRRPLGRDPRSSWWGQGIEEKFREPGHLSPCPRLSDGPRALRTNKHFGGMFKRNWQVVERGAPGRWRGEGRSPLEIEQEHRGRQ